MTKHIRPWILLLPLALLPFTSPLRGAEQPEMKPKAEAKEGEEEEKKPPEEKASKTRHSITLDGKAVPYAATAGTLVLKDDEGKAKASVFYVAYTREGVRDPAQRPVTFSFNGGPGAASLWVHLGAFGPKKVERDEEGMGLAPPGRLVDNEYSILDATDLVFIDPVSTGFSRPAPGEDPKQFHGVRQDVEWVGELIRLWVTRNERWASPKFVAGESYGTTRAAGLAAHLQDRYGMQLNGVILLSSVLNWQNQEFHVGNDMPYLLHLPSYAATAWYHKKLPAELAGDLRRTLAEAEAFALGEYASALLQGDRLPADRRREVAAKLARYTGLSPEYVERTNLRIDLYRYLKELLRDRGRTVGRLDSRFTGTDLDSAGEHVEYDPSSASLDGPYAAAINDYLRRDLGYEEDAVYERLTGKVWPWSFSDFENQYLNMAEVLRQAMTKNPDLRVLVASGYYDFATPYFDAVYTVDHLGLPPELRDHVKIAFYEAGHMMYVKETEHAKLKRDVVEFLRAATAGRR
jgi:carboxypeptidase C (cathepsin A)